MRIHARFRLDQVNRGRGFYKAPGETEAEPFGSATPSAHLDMGIVNPSAAKVFFEARIGQEFDMFFSPVEEEAQS